MPKKYVKIEKVVDNHHQVWNNKKEYLGDIYLEYGRWNFYPEGQDLKERIYTWFTWECLQQIADYMKDLPTR